MKATNIITSTRKSNLQRRQNIHNRKWGNVKTTGELSY